MKWCTKCWSNRIMSFLVERTKSQVMLLLLLLSPPMLFHINAQMTKSNFLFSFAALPSVCKACQCHWRTCHKCNWQLSRLTNRLFKKNIISSVFAWLLSLAPFSSSSSFVYSRGKCTVATFDRCNANSYLVDDRFNGPMKVDDNLIESKSKSVNWVMEH